MKRIIKIEANATVPVFPKLQRVAAYARVSTDEERQHMSLMAQMDYYKKLIEARPGWVFAGIYADNGVTGTSYRRREQFKRMIADCEAGKIDRIISKSISRFARNSVDTVNVIRHLKELGIGVEFEKEHIWTLDGKGEFVLTLMASFAQEESRSISENTAWGLRKRMADGKYWVGYKSFLGYGRDFVIEEEGAYVVRLIYRCFLQGLSTHATAKYLMRRGFRTPQGCEEWSCSTINSILRNEKYKGDALTQKNFIKGFPERKSVKNRGELEQHYVTGGHEPIIDPVLFDYVQAKIEVRTGKFSGISFIIGKFYCAECGRKFGLKSIHSNDKYRHNILQCMNRFRKGKPCRNRHFYEKQIPQIMNAIYRQVAKKYLRKDLCCDIVNKVVGDRPEAIRYIRYISSHKTVVDEGEWALLIDRVDVHRTYLEVTACGYAWCSFPFLRP